MKKDVKITIEVDPTPSKDWTISSSLMLGEQCIECASISISPDSFRLDAAAKHPNNPDLINPEILDIAKYLSELLDLPVNYEWGE